MKYIVILCDGMADNKLEELNGKTPDEFAATPFMDLLRQNGETGYVKTVPDVMEAGSDVANLAILGYDPEVYYSGRAPYEAASIGVKTQPGDTLFRVNLVTLSNEDAYENKTLLNYSADLIPTQQADVLIKYLNQEMREPLYEFFTGVSYRNILLYHDDVEAVKFTPPHNITNKKITPYIPQNKALFEMQKQSYKLLRDHPVNVQRIAKGEPPANSIWIWGQGKPPALRSFEERYGIKGGMISAVHLLNGIAKCIGMQVITAQGATGDIHTDYASKARAAVQALEQCDLVYIHIEAPDECGHCFDLENKIKSIENIDQKVVRHIYEHFAQNDIQGKIMVLSDHATPVKLGYHTNDPVQYIIYDRQHQRKRQNPNLIQGYKLMRHFIGV